MSPELLKEYHRVCAENNKQETGFTLELFVYGWEAAIEAAVTRIQNIDPLDGSSYTSIEAIADFVEGLR